MLQTRALFSEYACYRDLGRNTATPNGSVTIGISPNIAGSCWYVLADLGRAADRLERDLASGEKATDALSACTAANVHQLAPKIWSGLEQRNKPRVYVENHTSTEENKYYRASEQWASCGRVHE